jgi:hypothetical protein
MTLVIREATKVRQFARVCMWGIEKSGKTHAALTLATALAGESGKIGVISSEYGSSKLLSHKFPHQIIDLAEPDENGNPPKNPFSPQRYEEALNLFLRAGYQVIVIDSLSHSWAGEGGILETVDKKGGSGFSDGWRDSTPVYNHLINAILGARCHIIVTLRAKEAYVMEEYIKRNGDRGTAPKNVGQAPVMRKGFGFEMQLIVRMDNMNAHIEASGVEDYIHKGEEIEKPGPELALRLLEALDGVEPPAPLPTKAELFDAGKAKNMWVDAKTFYATLSVHLDTVVSQLTWEKLTREQVLDIAQMIESEPVYLPVETAS